MVFRFWQWMKSKFRNIWKSAKMSASSPLSFFPACHSSWFHPFQSFVPILCLLLLFVFLSVVFSRREIETFSPSSDLQRTRNGSAIRDRKTFEGVSPSKGPSSSPTHVCSSLMIFRWRPSLEPTVRRLDWWETEKGSSLSQSSPSVSLPRAQLQLQVCYLSKGI